MSNQKCATMIIFAHVARGSLWLALLFGGMIVGSSNGASVTGANSHNGVALFGEVEAAFETPGGGGARSGNSESELAHPALAPSAFVDPMAFAAYELPSMPGEIIDEARINLLSRFEFGSPIGSVEHDTWTFHVDGSASATVARFDGEPADALVSGLAAVQFFVDPITAPIGTTVGQIVFSPIQPLTAKETQVGATIHVKLREDGATILTLGPGAASARSPLVVGRAYAISAEYKLRVPAGFDPPFLVELGATFIPIPEPSTFALTIFALLPALLSHKRAIVWPVSDRARRGGRRPGS